MKKLSLKSLIFAMALSMGMILHALRQNVLARKKSAPRILLAAILPLSSKPRASRMIFKGMMCCALVIVCVGCRSVRSVESLKSNVESQEVHDSQLSTFDIQHSTLRDSIVYREKVVHDTVYITKEVYRNQRLSTFGLQHSTKADTVIVTEWRERVVEKPPERYIPRFYKISTAILYILIALIIVFIVIKIRLRCV